MQSQWHRRRRRARGFSDEHPACIIAPSAGVPCQTPFTPADRMTVVSQTAPCVACHSSTCERAASRIVETTGGGDHCDHRG